MVGLPRVTKDPHLGLKVMGHKLLREAIGLHHMLLLSYLVTWLQTIRFKGLVTNYGEGGGGTSVVLPL